MSETEQRFLAVVEVDSGTLLIGDPAYVLPRASTGRAGVDYDEIEVTRDPPAAMYFAGQPVLLIQQFGGDGTFPVFGEFDDGELIALHINLDPPVDDDDEKEDE